MLYSAAQLGTLLGVPGCMGLLASPVQSCPREGWFADEQDQSGCEDSEKGHSWTWHGITHNLSSQWQDQSGSEDSEKQHSWTWHGVTHILSTQQDQSRSKDSEKGHSWTWHGITHFLSSQQDQSG